LQPGPVTNMILSETLNPRVVDETKDHREISLWSSVLFVSLW